MPRVQIPITAVADTGTVQPSATAGDATNDHYLAGDTDCLVECKNTSAGELTVTFVTSYTIGGIALADNAVAVAAGAIKYVPLNTSQKRQLYKQSADLDHIYVNVDSVSWEFRAYAV